MTPSDYSSGWNYTTLDTYQLDPICLVDGKSTRDATIRDYRALVVRTESYGWKSGTWVLLSYTDFTYDMAGRLTRRVESNGGTYTAVYSGGLKISETNEAGVTTAYAYDAAGRVSASTRVGVGVIPSITTR